MRPGTRPAGSGLGPLTDGDGRAEWWARSRAGQAAGAGRPGGGSGASPSAARSRRTAWGSVTAPRIRRRPPQRSHTSTSKPNTRWSSRAQGQRRGARVSTSTRESGGDGVGTMADLQRDRGPRSPW